MDQVLSKTINQLRFPLAAGIVLLHYYTPDISAEAISSISGNQYPVYHYIGEFTSIIACCAVPLFFFISGYLYFNNIPLRGENSYSFSVWKQKSKNRVRSLLIPYLSWNLLVLLLFFIGQQIVGNSDALSKDGYKLVADYSVIDYLKAFYAIDSTGMPVDGPLWFIRDLFIVSIIITPSVYLLIKSTGIWGMILLTILFFMGISIPVTGFSSAAIFYFAWGAYMALHKKTMGVELRGIKANMLGCIIGFTLVLFTFFYFSEYKLLEDICRNLYILSVVFCVFGWIGRWVKQGILQIPVLLSTASFFIFAFHKPAQVLVRRAFFGIFHPTQEWLLVLAVFVIPAIVILISLGVFYLIKRYMPFLKFLNGYRL